MFKITNTDFGKGIDHELIKAQYTYTYTNNGYQACPITRSDTPSCFTALVREGLLTREETLTHQG
jgi:hypothetical protein